MGLLWSILYEKPPYRGVFDHPSRSSTAPVPKAALNAALSGVITRVCGAVSFFSENPQISVFPSEMSRFVRGDVA